MSAERAEQLCYIIENDSGFYTYDDLDKMKASMMEFEAELRLRCLACLKKTGRV